MKKVIFIAFLLSLVSFPALAQPNIWIDDLMILAKDQPEKVRKTAKRILKGAEVDWSGILIETNPVKNTPGRIVCSFEVQPKVQFFSDIQRARHPNLL